MQISDAQRDVRTAYLGGFAGQLASSLIWFASAATATWFSHKLAAEILILGGVFIFPLTQLVLRLMGRPVSLPGSHPMNALGMQCAFIFPLLLPLVFAATTARHSWFYPAVMIALGAHYLPFIFLYGMIEFGALALALVAAGVFIGMRLPHTFTLGAWLTAVLLLAFAFIGRHTAASSRH